MMEDDSGSNTRGLWARLSNTIRTACSSGFLPSQSEVEEGEEYVGTAIGNAYYANGNTTLTPGKVIAVDSLCVSASVYPFYATNYGISIEPEEKECQFCHNTTKDFKILKIGRMTDVVVCDMCQLKALSKVLSMEDKDDEGSCDDTGSCCGEKDCGHGCKEGKEE